MVASRLLTFVGFGLWWMFAILFSFLVSIYFFIITLDLIECGWGGDWWLGAFSGCDFGVLAFLGGFCGG